MSLSDELMNIRLKDGQRQVVVRQNQVGMTHVRIKLYERLTR